MCLVMVLLSLLARVQSDTGCETDTGTNIQRCTTNNAPATTAGTTSLQVTTAGTTSRTAVYTSLREMTAADAAVFDAVFEDVASAERRAQRILADLARLEGVSIGANVCVLQHSLQMADAAFSAGEDEEFVVAALVHDIGEVLVPVSHGEVAAALLRPHVSPATTWLLEHHEVFQFAHYGAAWGVAEPDAIKLSLHAPEHLYKLAERFTEYDQAAFDPTPARQISTQALWQYKPMLARILLRPSYWWLQRRSEGDSGSAGEAWKLATAKAQM